MRRLALMAAVVCSGCGDGLKRVDIRGTITADGKPLDNAVLQFIPLEDTQGIGGMGRSDQNGNFTVISSRKGDPGIPPGKYKVRVSRMVARDGTPLPPDAKQADAGGKESVPPRYTSLEGTTLTVTVPETGGDVPIVIPEKLVLPK